MEQPNIAVVIPCYNVESKIDLVIKNIPDFVNSIIVVDDKSTDDTINCVNANEDH